MANNPVQIILNDRDFHQAPDPGTPPRNKDFFDKADAAFAAHKKALLAAVDAVIAQLRASPYGPLAYVRVQMRSDALAKSYRPVGWLFKRDQFPCVGADAVGTLYFEAPLIYLPALRTRIEAAELIVETKHRKSDGAPYKAPTAARAEVGAVETIEIAPPEQKRGFSVSAALAALDDPRAVSGYSIELFNAPVDPVIADDPVGRGQLLRSLEGLFLGLGLGARAFVHRSIGRTPVLELQLTRDTRPALIDNRSSPVGGEIATALLPNEVDRSPDRHEAALGALQDHPLVRAILPPILLQIEEEQRPPPSDLGLDLPSYPLEIPPPAADATYPVVGVIDSGVAPVLDEWVVGRFDYLSEGEFNAVHGTAVAGLVSVPRLTNNSAVVPDAEGCRIYDVPLFPARPFFEQYSRGFVDFLEEVEQAVAEGRRDHGVRVFNLSINAVSDVERYRYSIYASRLDQIADAYGVIFVNTVGNLPRAQARAAWPRKPGETVRYFASRAASDTIYKPSESVRSISVGAINPPGTGHLEGAPAVYTTRGPGLQVGVKPDVVAYGGAGVTAPGASTGLSSIDVEGRRQDVVGTSFAAPLVARTLAGLDAATNGGLHVEALRAMLLHHSSMPEPLRRRSLKDLARQFAGFGQPASVVDMLETGDHQITLLFQSRLSIGERKPVILRFPFTWPESLTDENGGCSGRARITLVYAPPLDPAFGAEFVRVNLEASLKQLQPEPAKNGDPRFLNEIDPLYYPKSAHLAVPEKALIDHGLKWWPSKQYLSNFDAVGVRSQWRLEVTSLVRAETRFPAEGVPFAVLLTIEDPDGKAPVFQELRQHLRTSQANAQDVRTAVRLRAGR
ncbi:S8 family peptidase [Sphingomonas sp. NPDC079357]|uniref:S8 family peptidase n=1 Tax=Sphingomonas sp. NPDC079357 TaxID=3364518 RepID=UPI0038507108